VKFKQYLNKQRRHQTFKNDGRNILRAKQAKKIEKIKKSSCRRIPNSAVRILV